MEIMTPDGMVTLTKEEKTMLLEALKSITDCLIIRKHSDAMAFINLYNKLNADRRAHYRPVYYPMYVRVKRKKGKVARGKVKKGK